MAFIDQILQRPSYGWKNDKGELVVPSNRTLFKEALSRLNIFASRKNWISVLSVLMVVCLLPFFYFFIVLLLFFFLIK